MEHGSFTRRLEKRPQASGLRLQVADPDPEPEVRGLRPEAFGSRSARSCLVLAHLLAWSLGCGTAAKAPHQHSMPVDFELLDLEGRVRTAAEFRGKVVLVDLWATWCEPCKASFPTYDLWQTELADRGFIVLAVAVDDDLSAVAEFARELAPALLVLRDASADLAARFDLRVLPGAFLLDRRGRLTGRYVGSRSQLPALRAHIEQLLAPD